MPSPRTISRRDFLAASAAGVAVGAVVGRTSAAEASPYGPWTVGAQSYCFREFSLEQALKQMQTLGLRSAEFYSKHVPPDSSPEQVRAILNTCQQYGVKPVAFGVHRFTKDHDANRKAFEFARLLGIHYFSANPDRDSFDSLDKLCDEYKVAIGIHPHGPTGRGQLDRWYSAEVILPAVKDHHPLIGTCIDTGHIIRAAQLGKRLDPADEVRKMGARNFGLHLKDHDNERKTDVVFGKGVLDVPAVLRALKEVNFKGWISLEYEANPTNPTPDMAECLKVLRDAVKQVG